jgi:fluoride exporter
MLKTIFFVAIGGAIGCVFRYLLTLFVNKYYANNFPIATFLINILGCFLIGLLTGYLEKNNLSDYNLKLILITGFCGGFTTFSAFGLENYQLFQQQHSFTAFLYIGLSVFFGIMAIWFGLFMNKLI